MSIARLLAGSGARCGKGVGGLGFPQLFEVRGEGGQMSEGHVSNGIKHGVDWDVRADKANQWPSIRPHAIRRAATRTADNANKIGSNSRDSMVKDRVIGVVGLFSCLMPNVVGPSLGQNSRTTRRAS